MAKTVVNSSEPIKKMWGTSEVIKEVYNGNVVYEPNSVIPGTLYFTSDAQFTLAHNSEKTWGGTIEYSVDGSTWNTWDGGTITSAELNKKHSILLRGTGNTVITGAPGSGTSSFNTAFTFSGTSGITVFGPIMALIDYAQYLQGVQLNVGTYAFKGLFRGQTLIVDAENLVLDKQIHNTEMYCGMFMECSGLTKAPKYITCYDAYVGSMRAMFDSCSALEYPPEFDHGDRTDLAPYNYMCDNMFWHCTSLLYPLSISNFKETGDTSTGAYSYMYQGCTNLRKITLPLNSTQCGKSACKAMYEGCSYIYVKTSQTSGYTNYPFVLPTSSGSGAAGTASYGNMFKDTGFSGVSSPSAGTTYYTLNVIV